MLPFANSYNIQPHGKVVNMGREKKDDARGRNWATIVYSENHDREEIIERLNSCHVKWFLSPLHDLDKWKEGENENHEAGEPKKAHYHVLVMFDGNKSVSQMKAIFKEIDGVGCERVSDLRSYSRYLCHLDEGGLKPLYNVEEVRQGGGADFRSIARSDVDRVTTLQDILLFIRHNELTSYDDLIDLCIDSGLTDYLDLITKTYHHVIIAYMAAKSKKFWAREQARKDLDIKERQDQHEELMLQILDSMRRRK